MFFGFTLSSISFLSTPLREGRRHPASSLIHSNGFLSTPLREGRLYTFSDIRLYGGFYPRPYVRGDEDTAIEDYQFSAVSIHAPT